MAITLAMLVMAMTASTSRKLPKVSCPIENENDRSLCEIGGNSDDMMNETGLQIRRNIRRI
jgi:hypothetical protein